MCTRLIGCTSAHLAAACYHALDTEITDLDRRPAQLVKQARPDLIALSRSVHDPRTRAYLQRRTRQGRTKREILRCLKRYMSASSTTF